MKKILVAAGVLAASLAFAGAKAEFQSDRADCLCRFDQEGPYAFCYHITYHNFERDSDVIRKQLKALRDSGARWVRADLSWPWQGRDEKTGQFRFENVETSIRLLDEYGLKLLPIIHRADGHLPLHEHLDEWGDFISQAVTRFKGRITHWEIWNEQNFTSEECWGGKDLKTHTANYAKCLKAAYKSVKAADPNAVVLYGGTAHVPLDFIRGTLEAGAGEGFDIMNVHPYNTDGIPEDSLESSLRQLRILLDEFGLKDKPIWATEIGWSTSPHPSSDIYKRVLPPAFQALGIDTRKVPLTVLRGVWSPVRDYTKYFPPFGKLEVVDGDDIGSLDPKKSPVLLPSAGEVFAAHRKDALYDYVKKGGTIILPQGIPFCTIPTYLDEKGRPRPGSDKDLRKELHIEVQATWSWGHPTASNVAFSADGPATDEYRIRAARYLSDRLLKPGDTFTPVLWGVNGDFRKPIGAAYKYNSELKGGAVVVTEPGCGVRTEITPADQARFIVRAHLIALGSGVERMFWYSFISNANGKANEDVEANYGITYSTEDGKPEEKPAYVAYKTLTRLMPAGSSRPKLAKLKDDVRTAEWTRPDGRRVLAAWTPYFTVRFTPPGRPVAVSGLFGERLAPKDVKTVGPDPVFFIYQ